MRPVQGLASLVYGALSYAVTRQGDVVLSHNYPCAPVYAASLTQSLRRHESRHQTLAHFRDHTDVVFQSIEQYIDRTVQQQLDQTLDDIARRWQPDAPPGIKKTLILMGYFYGKRTRSLQGQGRAQQGGANLANGMGRATFTQSSNTDNAPPSAARRAHLQALSHNPQMTAMQQAAVADVKLLASKPMLLSFANTEDLMASVEAYSARLKYAAYADIDQALQRSSFPLTHDDRLALWRLCVGAQLIVSHALNDARLKSHGKLNRLLAAISPTTQATPIPAHYVDLIRKAGFIVDYIGVMGYTSECRKRKFADAGKIRWSLSPSNTERALLITFSILVVSSLDIGKLLMGIHDWRTTREALAHACTTISESALAQRP